MWGSVLHESNGFPVWSQAAVKELKDNIRQFGSLEKTEVHKDKDGFDWLMQEAKDGVMTETVPKNSKR